jgi:hypothetical protein
MDPALAGIAVSSEKGGVEHSATGFITATIWRPPELTSARAAHLYWRQMEFGDLICELGSENIDVTKYHPMDGAAG